MPFTTELKLPFVLGLLFFSSIIRHEKVVVVVVLTLTHRYSSAVRDHRTGSNNSGAENYLRSKKIKTEESKHNN